MPAASINRNSSKLAFALSLMTLLTVLNGYLQARQSDEDAGAHIFLSTTATKRNRACARVRKALKLERTFERICSSAIKYGSYRPDPTNARRARYAL